MDGYRHFERKRCLNPDSNTELFKAKRNHLSYIVQNILPDSSDIHLNKMDTISLFMRLFNLFSKVKEFNLSPLKMSTLLDLCSTICKIITELQSSITPHTSIFALTLHKAMNALGFSEEKKNSHTFNNFFKTHYSELDSHIEHNVIQPVKLLEKKLLQQVTVFIHETQDFQVISNFITTCPTINVDLLTNENQQTVIHAISLVGEDDSKLTSACLKYVPYKNLQQFINMQRTDDGNTALHLASENGKRNIVQCLLEHGASTLLRNSVGQTVLDVAANDVITTLIKKATSFDSTNINAQFFDTFLKKNNVEDTKLPTDTVDLFDAINCSNVGKVEEILKRDNSCVNEKNKLGISPLIKAIGLDNVDIIRILLQSGADVSEFYSGMNTLHLAVKKGDVRIVKLFLDYVKDVNVRSQVTGETALHMASENGHVAIVKLLLAHGANFELKNDSANTPLEVSINKDITDLLKDIADLHTIVQKDNANGEDSLTEIFLKAKRSDNYKVFLNAKNENGKTAIEQIIKDKGPLYLLFKKIFLCTPETPAGS